MLKFQVLQCLMGNDNFLIFFPVVKLFFMDLNSGKQWKRVEDELNTMETSFQSIVEIAASTETAADPLRIATEEIAIKYHTSALVGF